jgi:CDP-glycerol glycerophosphotransferase
VLETGYPRNDALLAPDRDAARARVRERLGVPEDAVAVLYAPTWRDDAAFSLELDLAALSRELGERFVVLLRAHHLVASTVALRPHPRVRDVSREDDVTDLLLAADALVTDYSSVMFDFAVTGKPMLFFTYDLDRYRDQLRGFYFDLAEAAPAPLLGTSDEVLAAIAGIDPRSWQRPERYLRFQERFCSLEDGHAAERVVERVWGAKYSDGGAPDQRRRPDLQRRGLPR